MAEQVLVQGTPRNTARELGVLLFVLLGGLIIGAILQPLLTPVLTAVGGVGLAIAQSNGVVGIIWPIWAIVAVEALYTRVPPYQRLVALSTMRAVVSVLAVGFFWEIGARALNNKLVVVPLSDIWAAFLKLLEAKPKPVPAGTPFWEQIWLEQCVSRQLCLHTSVSFQEFFWGFLFAAVLGIVLGLLLATNERVRDYFEPWLAFLYAVPLVAIAPLFIVALGIGIMSKIVVIFLVSIFIIVVNTDTGVRSTDPHLIEAARSFGATRVQIFFKVLLPYALPFIIAGLRLGMARGLVGVVVAELFGAKAGLGFMILSSSQVFDTASLFVGVLVLAIAGYLGVVLLKYIEWRMAPWRRWEFKD